MRRFVEDADPTGCLAATGGLQGVGLKPAYEVRAAGLAEPARWRPRRVFAERGSAVSVAGSRGSHRAATAGRSAGMRMGCRTVLAMAVARSSDADGGSIAKAGSVAKTGSVAKARSVAKAAVSVADGGGGTAAVAGRTRARHWDSTATRPRRHRILAATHEEDARCRGWRSPPREVEYPTLAARSMGLRLKAVGGDAS